MVQKMIKKSIMLIFGFSVAMFLFTGCTNSQVQSTATATATMVAPTQIPSASADNTATEDLTSEGTMGNEEEDIGEVPLTAEQKAFFGAYDGNAYTNNWLGFKMVMPEKYSFYKVPQLMELYNDVLSNMNATRVKDKTTGIALGSDADGNCLTINATYIKSGATTTDATSYVAKIKSDLQKNSESFTAKDGTSEKIKSITYKTFTCEYTVGGDKFYEKHYWTVKDGYVVDISFSSNSSTALAKLVTAFKNSK